MAVSAGMIAKAAATVLSNEKLRKGVGWTLVAILSPIIVLIALLCSIGSGGADHNNQAVAASFYGVSYSTEVPAEFRHHIEEMRTAFSLLDSAVASVNGPIGAVLTLLAAQLVIPALPYLLSFAAGAMLYVVVEELIPEMSQGRHSNLGTVFFAVGFSVMMVLDVALG